MNELVRPLPHPSELTAPHWEGARQRRLMVQRCDACGGYVFIPRQSCTHCFSEALTWVESSGRGTIYSFSIVHRPQGPAFDAPYCVAIVELAEGWHMLTNIVGTPMEEIAIGDRVVVDFLDVAGMSLPVFRLAGD